MLKGGGAWKSTCLLWSWSVINCRGPRQAQTHTNIHTLTPVSWHSHYSFTKALFSSAVVFVTVYCFGLFFFFSSVTLNVYVCAGDYLDRCWLTSKCARSACLHGRIGVRSRTHSFTHVVRALAPYLLFPNTHTHTYTYITQSAMVLSVVVLS